MRKVQLITGGDRGFVAEVDVPPFLTMPDVLIWGERYFKRESDDLYVEAFTYWVAVAPEPVVGQ